MKKIILAAALVTVLAGCTEIDDTQKKVDNAIETGGAYSKEVVKENTEIKVEETPKGDKITLDSLEVDVSSDTPKYSESLKVLSNHEITIETVNLEETSDLITGKTHTLGGYIESNKKENKASYNSSFLSIKVPKEKAVEMEEFIKDKFHIAEESIDSVDVSDRFYDVDSRLQNIQERENRLLEMYKTAKDVEEVLLIDEKLFEVIGEKEELKRQKIKIEDRFSFTRIDINLKEVRKLPAAPGEKGEISQAFSTSMGIIKNILGDIMIIFIKLLPALVFAILVTIVLSPLLLKKYKRKILQRKKYNNNK